jgi:hypothetical protein
MRELHHGDLVRLTAWHITEFARVGTVRGYELEQAHGDRSLIPAAHLRGLEAEQRAISLGHELAWTTFTGHALVNDGGAHRAELFAKGNTAVELTPDESVEIEGRRYRVMVNTGNRRCPRNCVRIPTRSGHPFRFDSGH